MRNDIYHKLQEVARAKRLIGYDELNTELELGLDLSLSSDRNLLGQWLGEISENEAKQGRHMLSSLVVHKKGDYFGYPGKGYFEFARELGVHTGEDDVRFWAKEVKWLHQYWGEH